MTVHPTVLRDVDLAPVPHRLQRQREGDPPSVAPTANVKLPATVSTRSRAVGSKQKVVVEADVNGPTRQQVEIADTDSGSFANGYQEGYRKAKQEADQDMRRLAEQLAVELAQPRVEDAIARAKAESARESEYSRSALQDEWQQKLTQLDALLEQFALAFHSQLAEAEDDMLALVYEVVCRMLGEVGASLPGLRTQLQQCMKAWHGHALLNVEMNPDDLALLQSDEDSLKLLRSSGFSTERSTLRWVADPSISLGGCRLRSAEGVLDARLEIQFKALEATLLSTRASRKHLASMERNP